MLNLAVAQIELSLRSGNDSVTSLANSFTSMAGNVETINDTASSMTTNDAAALIQEKCHSVSTQMHSAIIAFQFYDKLTQRLSHLSNSIAGLADLVKAPEQLYSPYAWHDLQNKIKSTYTVESDIAMFEAILNGQSVAEALQASDEADKMTQQNDDDDVELF